jgi:hypothetical protein
VVSNKEKRDFILNRIVPIASFVFEILDKLIAEEIAKGAIRPIRPLDLILNIASLNVLSYFAAQIYFGFDGEMSEEIGTFLAERKKNNVEVILKSLKIDH